MTYINLEMLNGRSVSFDSREGAYGEGVKSS